MTKTELIGYVRKSPTSNVLKLNMNKKALLNAKTYISRDGEEYISLVININNINGVLSGLKEVTSICQVIE